MKTLTVIVCATALVFAIAATARALPLDAYEDNNLPGEATELSGAVSLYGVLNIHDKWDFDFFKWTATSDGNVSIDILFTHADVDGDIDMFLYDIANSLVAMSKSNNDNEQILLASVAAGDMYLLRVNADQDQWEETAAGNTYDLVITGSATAPVPEPATMLLLGTGLVGLVGFRKKFKK